MLTDADLDRMRGQIQRNGCLFRTDVEALIEEVAELRRSQVRVTVIEAEEQWADYRRWANG